MNVLKSLVRRVQKRNEEYKKQCFKEHCTSDGKCHGVAGGDRYTDYLSYACIDCKYLDMIIPPKQ